MDENVKKNYEYWCTSPIFDDATKSELKSLEGNEDEIFDRFYRELEFGTGGLRGVIGAGTNRMNFYTVGKATQGLANFINKQGAAAKGVAIAFDSRRMSPEFADTAACVLAANGIKAYIFDSLRPTPELSFALRTLGCTAGIVVTASHNPPEYNGYKVYWEDGAQITPPHDKGIMAEVDAQIIGEVNAIKDYAEIKKMTTEEAKAAGLYEVIGKEIDDKYMEALKKLVLHPEAIKQMASSLKIVYTPLHGTGNVPVRRVLKELGFEQVTVVPEQELPDGNFPTVSYPNPEDKKAFALALDLAKKIDADLVLATDPDADRLGVYAKDTKTGEYKVFTGNMSGMLICEYEMSQKKALGILPENGALVTTIVSSNMAQAVAKEYGMKFIECLTGFKYIGEQIKFFEQSGSNEYVFGFEESYGCLVGTHARDKDAIVATMALCEAAAYYKKQGKTLWDQMLAIYDKYGYYKDSVKSVTMKGIEGLAKIAQTMENLRANAPENIGPYKVLQARDYKLDTCKNMETGEVTPTGLPQSNVLYYDLEDGAWLCVRPSGTEPKIKLYYGVKGSSMEDAENRSAELGKYAEALLG